MSVIQKVACVDLPALPLQLVLAEQKSWRKQAVAIVAEDKPQAAITWVNELARASGILPGMRYSQGLSLCASLQATTVSDQKIDAWKKRIVKTLRRYSPRIDPAETGVFFIDASGLKHLYPSLEFWARAIMAELKGMGLQAVITIGHERMTTYAISKASKTLRVFDDVAKERTAAYAVALDRLQLETRTRDRLFKLGITTVGQLVMLPEDGLSERFGREVATLVATWKGHRQAPLTNETELLPTHALIELDEAEGDSERLLFLAKRLLDPLLAELAERGEAVKELRMRMLLDRQARAKEGERLAENIAPSEPTLDSALLLDLVRLKLNALFSSGVSGGVSKAVKKLTIEVVGCKASPTQLSLFVAAKKRDLRAAERAFSRLRAEFGDDAVMMAKPRDGHLPQARFQLTPMQKITTPAPRLGAQSECLIRRFYPQGIDLPSRSRRDPEGWLIGGLALGAVTQISGPHIISGGWWRGEIQRDFYFVEVKRGDLLWVYYDHTQRKWRMQGRVE